MPNVLVLDKYKLCLKTKCMNTYTFKGNNSIIFSFVESIFQDKILLFLEHDHSYKIRPFLEGLHV